MLRRTYTLIYGLVILATFGFGNDLAANTDKKTTNSDQEELLRNSRSLIYSFKNDSALLLLQPLLDQLVEDGTSDSDFGLEVQLAHAKALRQDNQYKKAIASLNVLKDKCSAAEQWETFAGACLELSTLYSNVYRGGNAKRNLELARAAIQKYQLEATYPLFLVRMAFWHQNHYNADSVRYFANLVEPLLKDTDRPDLAASYYSILGFACWETDYPKSIKYHQKASEILREISDFVGLSYNWWRIFKVYEYNYKYDQAMLYNDSAIMACYWAIQAGHTEMPILHDTYQGRGRLHTYSGNMDSAYHYTKRGFDQEIRFMRRQERDKVVEIDERYKDEQKAQQLAVKEQELQLSRQRLIGLLVVTAFVLIFAVLLFRNYAQLRKANRLVVKQSKVITETNTKLTSSLEQQILLQGEIHHRVKNNLQVIISLLEMQKEDIEEESTRASLEAMSSRIYSMAAIHDELYNKEGEHLVDILQYTKKLCQHLSALAVYSEPQFDLSLPKQLFNLDTIMPLGIILNELLTNSIKYASQKGKQLMIDIQMKPHGEGFILAYRDNGPGFSNGQLQDREGGLGSYLIRSMSRQLRGSLETKNDGGAVFNIYFKEKNRAA